jgi:integrase
VSNWCQVVSALGSGSVQELLGHSSVAMTIDRYSHVLPGMGDATANAIDAVLS